MKEPKILVNMISTPDGTTLVSNHRHDYVTYRDKNGLIYMVDGGNDYLRRTVHEDHPYTEMSVYSTDDHLLKRNTFTWGTYGKDGKSPLRRVLLKLLAKDHIEAILETQHHLSPQVREMFEEELREWR